MGLRAFLLWDTHFRCACTEGSGVTPNLPQHLLGSGVGSASAFPQFNTQLGLGSFFSAVSRLPDLSQVQFIRKLVYSLSSHATVSDPLASEGLARFSLR